MVAPSDVLDAVIVGAGFAGLGMAIKLDAAETPNFVILERGDRVGGTWRDNHYPGCACDVPAHLYSFSFEPNPSGRSRTRRRRRSSRTSSGAWTSITCAAGFA